MTGFTVELPPGWVRLASSGARLVAVHGSERGGQASIVALEYAGDAPLAGVDRLYVVEEGHASIGGRPARRMDLTRRQSGRALFTRRWLVSDGPNTLEIAATCPVERYGHFSSLFDELAASVRLAA